MVQATLDPQMHPIRKMLVGEQGKEGGVSKSWGRKDLG